MKKNIIIINGSGGCGKDTFIEYASKYAKITNFSTIDKVKEVARVIGWTGTKTEKDRKFLSDLKKLTTEYNDMAFNDMKEAISNFSSSDNEFLFIHIREPEEIKRAVDTFGAKTLLIKRIDTPQIVSNYSDASVYNYNYDFEVVNTTLIELEKEAQKLIKQLKEEV